LRKKGSKDDAKAKDGAKAIIDGKTKDAKVKELNNPVDHKLFGSTFVKDITIPDNASVAAGSKVVKTWLVKNTGKVTWSGEIKVINLKTGKTEDFAVPVAQPGQEVEVSVNLTIPAVPGKYRSPSFSLAYKGKSFGHHFWAIVKAEDRTQRESSWAKVTDTKARRSSFGTGLGWIRRLFGS